MWIFLFSLSSKLHPGSFVVFYIIVFSITTVPLLLSESVEAVYFCTVLFKSLFEVVHREDLLLSYVRDSFCKPNL